MTPRKPVKESGPSLSAKRGGLLPQLKTFMEALTDRYQRVLQVIDEALASDSLKDKIWAVDLILKRTPAEPSPVKPDAAQNPVEKAGASETLASLSDAELLARIRSHLREPE